MARQLCPCGEADLTDEEMGSDHASRYTRHADYSVCAIVSCESFPSCTVLDALDLRTATRDELIAAVQHWRGHVNLGGCSHGL